VLKVTDLTITLPQRGLFQGLSFDVAAGEVLAIVGPSGLGKSTLLDWMCGLLNPPAQGRGVIQIDARDITDLPCEQRRLGLMTQTPMLFPHLDVLGNLKFAARQADTDFSALLEQAGLAGTLHQDVATLSGGQIARVSLLRTLLAQPQAVLLDEPFARLDAELRSHIRQFVWQRCQGIPVVLVTHDPEDIPAGSRVIQLQDYAC